MATEDLQPYDYRFTMAEAVQVSGVTNMNLRNWINRETVRVGMKHKLGRWLFCPVDVIRLRTISDLALMANMPVSDADEIANMVVDRCLYSMTPSKDGTIPIVENARHGAPVLQRIYIYSSNGEVKRTTCLVNPNKTAERDKVEHPWFFRPHLVIPVDELIADVFIELFMMVDAEDGPNWQLVKNEPSSPDKAFREKLRDTLSKLKEVETWLGEKGDRDEK